MTQFARVATFEADDAALDAMLGEIRASESPPEGIPAKRITVLADRSAGRVIIAVRFDTEDDLRKGSETLDAMEPPSGGSLRRISVEAYEVVLEMEA